MHNTYREITHINKIKQKAGVIELCVWVYGSVITAALVLILLTIFYSTMNKYSIKYYDNYCLSKAIVYLNVILNSYFYQAIPVL